MTDERRRRVRRNATQRKQRRELRRENLLRVAGECFDKQGYHATTIADIARKLNTSKAALYYYVKNKEELLYHCHQAALDIGMEGMRRALAATSRPDEQLRIALAHWVEGMTSQLKGTTALLEGGALAARHLRRVIEGRDQYERMLRTIIEEGIRIGIFAPCDPKLTGLAILGSLNWISKWYDPAGERDPKEIAEAFATFFVRGLTGDCERGP